jgi:hypothetical protein
MSLQFHRLEPSALHALHGTSPSVHVRTNRVVVAIAVTVRVLVRSPMPAHAFVASCALFLSAAVGL